MDANRFTEKAREALADAQKLAAKFDHQQIDAEHVLLALLDQPKGLTLALLNKLGASTDALTIQVQRLLDKVPKVTGQGVSQSASARFNKILAVAEDEAKKLKDEFLSVEHLLLALAVDRDGAGQLLKDAGAGREQLLRVLGEVRGKQRVTSQNPEETYQSLEKYGRDLTEMARKGKLDPVIGRDEEIRRVMQILSRRTKNNPVLIGEPGVG